MYTLGLLLLGVLTICSARYIHHEDQKGHVQHQDVPLEGHQEQRHQITEHQEENDEPNYKFEYKVDDEKTGDHKRHRETRKGDEVNGYYSLKEADGTMREVHYTSTKHGGFNAVVTKSGTPNVHQQQQQQQQHHEVQSEQGHAEAEHKSEAIHVEEQEIHDLQEHHAADNDQGVAHHEARLELHLPNRHEKQHHYVVHPETTQQHQELPAHHQINYSVQEGYNVADQYQHAPEAETSDIAAHQYHHQNMPNYHQYNNVELNHFNTLDLQPVVHEKQYEYVHEASQAHQYHHVPEYHRRYHHEQESYGSAPVPQIYSPNPRTSKLRHYRFQV